MFGFGGKRRQSSTSANVKKRLLLVEIVEARGLLAQAKNGTSDPVAQLVLLDIAGRENKNENFRTKIKTGTLAPTFNETFEIGNFYNMDVIDDLPSLCITIFHKAPYSVAETPLGMATINLDQVDQRGEQTLDQWYPLGIVGRMKHVSGEVRVKLKFNSPSNMLDLEEGNEDDMDEAMKEAMDEKIPNELNVTIVQARRLLARNSNFLSGGGPSSDPLCVMKIEGYQTFTTTFKNKTLAPYWNEKFSWAPMSDPQASLRITVEDKETIKNHFLGRVAIPLSQFLDKKPSKQWYKLLNKQYEDDGTERGDVEVQIHWKYNVAVEGEEIELRKKKEGAIFNQIKNVAHAVTDLIGVTEGSDDEVDPTEMDAAEKEAETKREKTPEELEEEKKKAAEKQKELEDIEIKPGDYQIQVHIIEARELKAENLNGTSDPICFVECFKQKRNTIVVKNVTSCVYDELFIFNLKDLDKETFEQGMIRIACYDSGMLSSKGTMIGAFACDATTIYTMNKDHEMYRAWVPLMDDEDPGDVGVQGYLKISIQIVGPGEKVKVHDEEAERAAEIVKETAAGSDIGSMIMSPPTMIKEWKFLVVRLFKAEGLPIMDGKVGVGFVAAKKAGTDAFAKLSFAGGKPLKSKVVTTTGDSRAMMNPFFMAEMWYPVSMPTMTQVIRLNVWDHDPEKAELIGNIIERLNRVKKANGQCLDIQWYNMYGAHEFKTEKLLANVKKGAELIAKKAKQTIGADIDWRDFYNNTPEKASSYKGRVLMQISLVDKRPEKYEKKEIAPFRRKLGAWKSSLEPPTSPYILQALFLSGAELPTFGLIAQPLRVRVSIGIHEISSKSAKWENGVCRWNEFVKSSKIFLPRDLAQLPDIFIYLVRDDNKPVCYKRISATRTGEEGKKQAWGFNEPAEWILLQEDKCIDALAKDIFPGNVLMKLGFGLASEAQAVEQDWNNELELSRQSKPYQVRVHVYQGRNLPAADSNGLCDPYLKVNFMGHTQTTEKKTKTVFPVYYQTLVFDNLVLPDHDNFAYASQVCLRLYDTDFDGDDYLGTTFFNLRDAFVTPDPDDNLPDPVWRPFFTEVPGDSQGEILMMVQVIPTFGKPLPKVPLPIVPASRPAFIEFIVIGIRDMAPFNFQNIQNPFLQIELNSFGTTFLSETKTSKKPEPMNPNFLERIMMPVELPENSIFTTPLLIKAKDTRLGGWLKPIVGVCQIDLLHKLPWCEETYKPPRTDLFFRETTAVQEGTGGSQLLPGGNNDEIAIKALELLNMRHEETMADDFIVSQEPISVDQYIQDRCREEDTGAGIFGALNHIKTSDFRDKGKRGAKDVFADVDFNEDDGDQPPAWMKNRDKLDSELEVKLETTPFETYNLLRGQVNGFLGSTIKVVGRLKGLVRVVATLEEAERDPLLPEALMNQLLKPKNYVLRLYALRAFQLTEMDYDIFGGKAKSDPYLRVKLGKKIFDDRKNAVEDVLEVDMYKLVVMETELPGISRMNIEVMDKDLVGGDELIGATSIDLEDRWFDSRWQEYGQENMVLPGQGGPGGQGGVAVRWKTKPIERRTLYAPGMSQSQGIFECYLDIMTQEEAAAFPPDDVALPPKQIFEVRVVIWKTKNVPPMDSLEGMSDLFVKVWPEGCSPQETDTHWRCKKGKASFNWRLLFDVELGHNTRAMKFPYLHIQLWDRDILKWNDCAGEGIVNLGRFYRKAYKRNVAIKLFEKKKGVAAKRAAKEKKLREDLIEDTTDDIPPENDDNVEAKGGEGMADDLDVITPLRPELSNNVQAGAGRGSQSAAQAGPPPGGYVSPSSLLPPRDAVDSDDDDDDDESTAAAKLDVGMGALPQHATRQSESRMKKVDIKKEQKAKQKKRAQAAAAAKKAQAAPASSGWAFWRRSPPANADEEGKPLLDEDGEAQKSEEEKKEDDESEMKEMVTSFKNMTGLWDIDPDDSAWYHLEQKDKNDPTKVTPMGSICYSIQIWPKDKAIVMAAGAARSEPNTNPFLPPPVGRLKFSWNPFVLGSELCGPALCAQFFCCLLCVAFIVLMIFCQPFLNIIINLIFVVY